MEKLADGLYLPERFEGKGGWTYVRLPGIGKDRGNPFGGRRVKGTIDGYPISRYHLMPMGKGVLFLPVRAEIRRRIGKQAGDQVQLTLYPDLDRPDVPEELLLWLEDAPAAPAFFASLPAAKRSFT